MKGFLIFLVFMSPLISIRSQRLNSCVDSMGYWACQSWRMAGICDNAGYYNYMYENCRQTCNLCNRESELLKELKTSGHRTCIDHRKNCVLWRKHCINTSTYYSFMQKHCRRSCLWCEDKTCADKRSKCKKFAGLGYCESDHKYFRFMNKTCQISCKFCSPKDKTKHLTAKSMYTKHFVCGFEEHTCEWENHHFGDGANWKIGTSIFGPKAGYNESFNYLFIDALFEDYKAKLWLPWQLVLPKNSEFGNMCFHFNYFLSGGELRVLQGRSQTLDSRYPKDRVLFRSKRVTNGWSDDVTVEVEASNMNYLTLVGTQGLSGTLVAVDNFYFTQGNCND